MIEWRTSGFITRIRVIMSWMSDRHINRGDEHVELVR